MPWTSHREKSRRGEGGVKKKDDEAGGGGDDRMRGLMQSDAAGTTLGQNWPRVTGRR